MTDIPARSSFDPTCLVNGVPASQVSAHDRGLAYGDGLFETMRVSAGRAPLDEYHFSRLEFGASCLHLPLNMPEIRAEISGVAAQLNEGVIKLIVTRGEGKRGYASVEVPRVTRIVQTSSLPIYPPDRAERGVVLYPCETRLAIQPRLAGVKHLNRLEQILARGEWQDDAFGEGLVCDMRGRPIECTMSNLFLRGENGWVTPQISDCGVRGVMRDYLVSQLTSAGETVDQRSVTMQELMDSSEMFCCNSVFGVWPIVGLKDRKWPVGPFTRVAQAMAQQI